jgi:hypothetical protein
MKKKAMGGGLNTETLLATPALIYLPLHILCSQGRIYNFVALGTPKNVGFPKIHL